MVADPNNSHGAVVLSNNDSGLWLAYGVTGGALAGNAE